MPEFIASSFADPADVKIYRNAIVALAAPLFLSACAAQAQETMVYRGSCDGSAVALLAADRFVTVSDEENLLRVFALNGGPDLADRRMDVGAALGLGKEEGDFEAAARIGDTIYWIASLGSGKKGGEVPSRRRFFATRVDGQGGLAILGTQESRTGEALFKALLNVPDLKLYDLENAAKHAPKTEGALNIEGLAPNGSGGLLIAFRNPLAKPDKQALVITLTNPMAVVAGTEDPNLIGLTKLKLGRRGIRDIALRPAHHDYLILAGRFDETSDFALYRWSGRPLEDPTPLPTAFGTLNPEGLAVLEGGRLLVLSDDGEMQPSGSNAICKDLPSGTGQFRGMILLPPD